jgi:hypothetical protein
LGGHPYAELAGEERLNDLSRWTHRAGEGANPSIRVDDYDHARPRAKRDRFLSKLFGLLVCDGRRALFPIRPCESRGRKLTLALGRSHVGDETF